MGPKPFAPVSAWVSGPLVVLSATVTIVAGDLRPLAGSLFVLVSSELTGQLSEGECPLVRPFLGPWSLLDCQGGTPPSSGTNAGAGCPSQQECNAKGRKAEADKLFLEECFSECFRNIANRMHQAHCSGSSCLPCRLHSQTDQAGSQDTQ